jgi:general secretion pathway protein D
VMIESLIIEVNATKAAEFGVQWQSALGDGSTRGIVGTNSSVSGANNNIISLALGLAAGTATTIPSAGLNLGIGRRNSDGQYTLGVLARFLEGNGAGNVLSTPQLLTLDNEEAKIVIGQNVPFPTGQYASTNGSTSSVNPFTTVERKDVGLTLRVRPQINENGTIKMQIFQEVSNVDASTRGDLNGPTTNKRSIESSVLVEDGSIVMLGGLLQDDYSNTNEKVPGLGDIPVVGNLFRNEVRKRTKTNLMVFIRPVVLRDGVVTEAFAADRYDTIRGIQQGTQPEYRPPLNNVGQAPMLPPLVLPDGTQGGGRPAERIEGTRLIPPPSAAQSSGVRAPAGTTTSTLPLIGPQRGALPPTSDPMSYREPN